MKLEIMIKFKFATDFDLNKCLNYIKLSISLQLCTPFEITYLGKTSLLIFNSKGRELNFLIEWGQKKICLGGIGSGEFQTGFGFLLTTC